MRVALLPSEPVRRQMAGIGIRYYEMARRLPSFGLDVVLVTPGDPSEVPEDLREKKVEVRAFERGGLAALLKDCDSVVAQGQLANDVVLECPRLPAVVDLYDPFLVENMHYLDTLGLDPYRNDHATWMLQMSRGDFFLCSCDEQRQFYLGFLAALGRVNPYRVRDDADARGLVDVVPFGVPQELPPHEPVLGERQDGERRLLFGGLYDWYDPWPVLEALKTSGEPGWKLLLIRNPNPDGTPQRLFVEVEAWCRKNAVWDSNVQVLDWVPAHRRYDLLRDVDLLVSTHTATLETRLSLRTRFLDALVAGCPVVTTEGGAMSRMLRERDAGWIVPEGDAGALLAAWREILASPSPQPSLPEGEGVRRVSNGRALAADFAWEKVLAPLVAFCRAPRLDWTKEDFAVPHPTVAPPDNFFFRARRFLRRHLG